jgi:RNA polymerase sigma factor (TIGR02999 family)
MSDLSAQEVTEKLRAWSDGNSNALNELLPVVYDELRRQAARYLRRERANHSLQTSELINEAYLKLVEIKRMRWQNRAHFFAMSATLMRRVLLDYARAKRRDKRGGDAIKLSLGAAETVAARNDEGVDLLALDEVLTQFARIDEQAARVVELRYFGGLSLEETAEALRVSVATVKRDWQTAKAWLRHGLGAGF